MNGPPVVVMGLDCPTGLQVARTFADRGVDVLGLAWDLRHPCVRTRSRRRQGCLSVEHRNDEVRHLAIRLFKEAGHHGPGYVESMWDACAGRYVVIEANVGRPTGRSTAAERAGVELLMTQYNDALGRPLPRERTQGYRGSKWIYLRRDIQACLCLLIQRRLSPLGMLRSWRGRLGFALFSWRDPVPFLADLARAVHTFPSVLRKADPAWSAASSGRPPGDVGGGESRTDGVLSAAAVALFLCGALVLDLGRAMEGWSSALGR